MHNDAPQTKTATLSFLLAGLFLSAAPTASAADTFTDLCSADSHGPFCEGVGATAYNSVGVPALREIPLGPIIGVAYKRKGALISRPEKPVRLAPRDGYYYIIGPGGVAE